MSEHYKNLVNTAKKLWQENSHTYIAILLTIATIIYFFHGLYHGERGPSYGQISDGTMYSWIAKNPFQLLFQHKISSYYIGRMLPSTIVYLLSKSLGYSIESPVKVVTLFYVYNMLVLIGSLYIAYLISKLYHWSFKTNFLFITLLVINFPLLKMYIYNPPLTGPTAFLLSITILYSYLSNKIWSLSIATLLGAFTWPTILYLSIPLILFPANQSTNATNNLPIKKFNYLAFIVAGFISIGALFRYIYYPMPWRMKDMTMTIANNHLIILSILALFLYLYFALRHFHFSNTLSLLKKTKTTVIIPRLLITIILYSLIHLVILKLKSNIPPALTIAVFIEHVLYQAIVNPGVFLISHTMFYGPGIILICFFWSRICNIIQQFGLGLILFIVLGLLISMGSESREAYNIWPIFAFLICYAFNKIETSWSFIYSFLALSFITSCCWLPMNIAPLMLNDGTVNMKEWIQAQKFPAQIYAMHQGPWLSHYMYFVFLMFVSVLVVALLSLIKHLDYHTKNNTK